MAKAAKRTPVRKKKTVRLKRRASVWELAPVNDGWRAVHYYVHYEIETKDWLNKIKEYIKANFDKKTIANLNKLPDWKIGGKSHYAAVAYLEMTAPDKVPESYQGRLKLWLEELAEEGAKIAEVKKEETKKKNVYVPTIRERMRDACAHMVEDIEDEIDKFYENYDSSVVKSFDPLRILRGKQAKPGHVRMIRSWYQGEYDEYMLLLNMPTAAKIKKMSEEDQESYSQLKEGYNHLTTKMKKDTAEMFKKLLDACDIIEAEAKTTRKPRKVKAKSPQDIVKKLKFKTSDSTYGIASIDPSKIIGSDYAVVFNCKTRKLGIYVASNIDPKGMGRPGSGLNVKGTTLIGFDEEKSLQKTLRKPNEQLRDFKKTTRAKTVKQFDALKTTDTKLNGRFNAETIILAVF